MFNCEVLGHYCGEEVVVHNVHVRHSYFSFFKRLQVISVGTDGNIFPFVELGDRLGQDVPDAVISIATQQDHRGEFFVLCDTLPLDDIYYDIYPLLRISRLVAVVG